MRTQIVVDAANVVGSVPDGWWRDRRGATERLRDSLVPYAGRGIAGHPGPVEIVLVVEGAAREVAAVPGVRVEPAPGSGDDRIVELGSFVWIWLDQGAPAAGAADVGVGAVDRKAEEGGDAERR
ncbi:NTP pyrophosphohydrolase [Streptomyces sp. NPDC059743]|uniref:NTP pyrophosphohydrolase n=1 Tax=Streptomyces sp. NPDC059743 TaxID=3346928 RepID=UPI003665E6DB